LCTKYVIKAKNYLLYLLCTFSVVTSVTSSAQLRNDSVEDRPSLIEVLQDGESYAIEITSMGCFGGTKLMVTLSKEIDTITAQFQDSTKELTETDILVFIAFEKQLRNLKMGRCTTVDTYVLRSGSETFQTSDGTCNWHGYRQILNVFDT